MSGAPITVAMNPEPRRILVRRGITPQRLKAVHKQSLRWIGGRMVAEMVRAISPSGQKQPGGKAWAKLRPRTIRAKEARQQNPIVIGIGVGKTAGSMRRSMIPDAAGFTEESDQVKVGPVVDYAKYFHYGTRYQAARPLAPTKEYALRIWVPAHLELLDRAVK